MTDLIAPLKHHFGYDSFKPLQHEIIQDSLSGRDVIALLPTGGGKSLCYQLPALFRPGLTIVVSPLIALMKDQVDALTAAGIAATFLNSSLNLSEAERRRALLNANQYRLLYVSPERLMMPDFLDELPSWNVTAVAVDEAHCISEWGHDFRPEYRMIAAVRDLFPKAPIMALTATATERVRGDIAKSLRLRDPCQHIGSFNRPNLNYMVQEKSEPYQQLRDFVLTRKNESGIVYGLSRNTADQLAARLSADGIKAAPYHAGLSAEERSRNQEAFIRDDVAVICATIAFGMGINKPNVRFVVHYDLPKHIEGYYQETGRAGRDGLPSQCLLLFQIGDVVKLRRFIDDIADEAERNRARQKLTEMVRFAESADCRRAALLAYFGEAWPHSNCKACDNCLIPRDRYDGTIVAQKFMSCIYRIVERSGFPMGLNHIATVMVGAMSPKVAEWSHDKLTTFGVGKELGKNEWKAVGRELVRLGLVQQNPDRMDAMELTPIGLSHLKQRTPIMLIRQIVVEKAESVAKAGAVTIECDEALFEELRSLRKQLADQRNVPAYVIFSDVSLRQMARQYPIDEPAFRRISGVGDQKLADFGAIFVQSITSYLQNHQRKQFDNRGIPSPRPRRLNDSSRSSLLLFRAGRTVEEIADDRGFAVSTIVGHLIAAVEAGEQVNIAALFTTEQQLAMSAALTEFGDNIIGAVERLGAGYDYNKLKLWRTWQRQCR